MNIGGGNDPSPATTAIGSAGGFFACRKTPLESGGRKEVKERMSTQMEKLLAAQEKTQEKLRRAQEEEKQLKKRIAELKRNERTHRLCTRGGYIEKLLAELGAPELSDEEVFNHLQYALNTPYAKTHLANLMEAKRKAAAEAEGTETGNLTD